MINFVSIIFPYPSINWEKFRKIGHQIFTFEKIETVKVWIKYGLNNFDISLAI